MRFTVAYYLLLIYLTVMLRPLLPILGDAWAHAFNETEHIATIHAKYGANHLEKELAGTGNENNKSSNTVKLQEPVSIHILKVNNTLIIAVKCIIKQYNAFAFVKPSTVFISLQAPPPKL